MHSLREMQNLSGMEGFFFFNLFCKTILCIVDYGSKSSKKETMKVKNKDFSNLCKWEASIAERRLIRLFYGEQGLTVTHSQEEQWIEETAVW